MMMLMKILLKKLSQNVHINHINATLLLNSGVDLKVVSEHLGHCDIGVTANVYADVLKSTKAKVANLIELKLE